MASSDMETDLHYSLAVQGVPIAEHVVIRWGGWKQTGHDTFRENYLGPVPDHITAAVNRMNLPSRSFESAAPINRL